MLSRPLTIGDVSMRAKRPRSKKQKIKDRHAAMGDLRSRIAGSGYHIFGVAKMHKGYALDFVAVLKDRPDQFLLVLGSKHGHAKVRPFCDRSLYLPVQRIIKDARTKAGIYTRWNGQIGFSLGDRKYLALKYFLTPDGQDEYTRLTGKSL